MNMLLLSLNFVLGLLSSFSPCLFPLLPTFLAIQVSQKKETNTRQAIGSVTVLILGLLLVLGLFATITTATIKQFLISNYIIFARVQATLLIIIGVWMLLFAKMGIEIPLPTRIENFLYSEETKNTYLFAFILGISYTIIAAPCALGYFLTLWVSILSLPIFEQFMNLLVFAVGAGIPFLFISIIPKSKKFVHMRSKYATFKKLIGGTLVVTGAYFWITTL